MKRVLILIVLIVDLLTVNAQKEMRLAPLPSAVQLEWSNMEFYLFTHFGPNTFTDLEWGKGTEPEDMFNPTKLDCGQWCRIAKDAGAKGIIITAKHHDGFCLWPSKFSTHTVAQSKWRNGKGDVLKELSEACKKYDLKLGIYLSPWDRNHPEYGTDAYNDVFVNMMKEVVSRYGPLFEFWWDGANGEGPNGKKQIYDWQRFQETLRSIAPNTPVFSDIGPDIRWVGNENGIAGSTNWNFLDTAGFKRGEGAPPNDTLRHGNVNGAAWIPAECDVSIRPGWFYHANEDSLVKTPEQLFDLYLKSVGRGASLLLNVPPDRRGLINEQDSAALMSFMKLRQESFSHDLISYGKYSVSETAKARFTGTRADGYTKFFYIENPIDNILEFSLFEKPLMNCLILKEPLEYGQRISNIYIMLENEDGKILRLEGTTIGNKRIFTFPTLRVKKIRIWVSASKGIPFLLKPEAFLIKENLVDRTMEDVLSQE